VSEFSYYDIFATKGFEYLLVIGFFLVLVGFWSLLTVPKKEIRKAQAEREELRQLLGLQRERMESEITRLRDQRESMQNALLAQLQLVEHRALAAWHETHPETNVPPPDLVKLLDWALAERETLAEDKKRLDYLTQLVQWKTSLYRAPGPDGSVVVDATGKGFGEGVTLRGAIDAARSQGGA
jgi:hypothetical protein